VRPLEFTRIIPSFVERSETVVFAVVALRATEPAARNPIVPSAAARAISAATRGNFSLFKSAPFLVSSLYVRGQ
jgi:hypothetical protein